MRLSLVSIVLRLNELGFCCISLLLRIALPTRPCTLQVSPSATIKELNWLARPEALRHH